MTGARGALVALVAAITTVSVGACSPTPSTEPVRATQQVADLTAPPVETVAPEPTPREATAEPGETPAASPGTAIVPGSVNRTSLDLDASYHVQAAFTVASGSFDVATVIHVRNTSGGDIDRLELNTIAARLGGMRITDAEVDGTPAKLAVRDQTIVVPLGGILPPDASASVLIGYRATLRRDFAGSDWMFTRGGGTLALYRWIPWLSRTVPFDRPNIGDPFVTPWSAQVDVELVVDRPMSLAAPVLDVASVPAGAGRAWTFSVREVRDVSIVLAPSFDVANGSAAGTPIRVYSRNGSAAAARLLDLAEHALRTESGQLGVDYPWPSLTVVETEDGEGLESPGLVWIPQNVDTLNRTYLVHHEIAHQWFYGLVGNDQQAEPFADEAPADLLARTVLDRFRASRCPTTPLDRAITGYSRGCYYEVVYVQGGRLLDDVRRRMGASRFWGALRAYLEDNRSDIAGTSDLLEALRAASPVDLLPILRARFPSLY